MALPVPVPSAALTTTNGRPSQTTHAWMQDQARRMSSLEVTATGAAAAAQTDRLSIYVVTPSDGDTVLLRPFPTGATISEVRTQSVSGTCTLTVKIGATALGGTANSVSSTETAQAHSSANVAVTSDNLTLTVSSNAACIGMSVTLTYTTTLASA